MPEGRMLKKKISESKKLAALKSDSARLLYTWLIPHLDVEGRHLADSEVIKGHVFPKVKSMTAGKIKNLLFELYKIGLIILYKEDSEFYLQLIKFQDHQSINPDREAKSSIPAPNEKNILALENSGVNPENSMLSKVKQSKVNESKDKAEKFGPLFEEFWKGYPREGRAKKKYCRMKFLALCKQGKYESFKKTTIGYFNFLEHKEKNEGFKQSVMDCTTWLNNWEEDMPRYVKNGESFKYEPRL